MRFNLRGLETKLLVILVSIFVLFTLIHAFDLLSVERGQAHPSPARHIALTAALLALSGSAIIIFFRKTKRRLRDLIRALSEGRTPAVMAGNPRDGIDLLASSLWQLIEKSRQSEQKYKDLVDNCHGIIIATDASGKITFVSKGIKDIQGYEPEEAIGTPLLDMVHPDDRGKAEEAYRRVLAGERVGGIELRCSYKSGRWLDFLGNGSPILAPGGEVQGVLIAGLEVTEVKKLEKHLQLLHSAVESSTDFISIADLDAKILYMNPAATQGLGYGLYEMVGREGHTLSTSSEQKIADALEAVRQGNRWTSTAMLRRKDGSVFPCEYSLTAIKDEEGRPFGVVGLGRDITQRVEGEERLRQAQKMETLGVLAGGIAHDFNNLLGGIVGYASILRSSLPKSRPEHRYASMIERVGASAAELTTTLLCFARKGKGRTFPVELNDLLKEVVSLFQATLHRNGNLETRFHPHRMVVEVDPTQIHQAILNVLINARDATAPNGKIEIETCIQEVDEACCTLHPECQPGRYAVISIKDDGAGMDDQTKKRVFEPFFTTKTDRRRTGLGLPITYNIVKNHQGRIDIESSVGRGTTVRIYLPLSDKELLAPAVGPEIETGDEAILVIDDDEMIRGVLSDMLSKLGYRVLLASNCREGTDMYRQRSKEIDLVIIDMVLSDLGGDELFRQLRMMNPRLRALLISAYPFDERASRVLDAGARGFIQKPFNLPELSAQVRQALDRE